MWKSNLEKCPYLAKPCYNFLYAHRSKKKKQKKLLICTYRCSPLGFLKFNINGEARGKPRLVGIGGVFWNSTGEILFLFSEHVGIKEFQWGWGFCYLEALRIFSCSFQGKLIVESDSSNVISWVPSADVGPCHLGDFTFT